MIVLDENLLDGQRLLLQAWRLPSRQIGQDFSRKGMKDEEIIPVLRKPRNSTFFTRDAGFFAPHLRHTAYCIVVASVGQNEVATFIRRFLRRPDFDTQMKRVGSIVRISHGGISFRRLRSQTPIHTVGNRA